VENYLLLADGSRVDLKMQSGSTNLETLEVDITFISQYYDIGGSYTLTAGRAATVEAVG
jgi:hypothetical protein